ncbi:MAG: RloB family protein [Candidatus Tectomicrobia bacterium]|nr:RloB family protein [Candidatus Tectomicrobia bacterium]
MKPSRRNIRKLGRSRASREPRQGFVLFCEGLNTEVEYFKAIRRIYSSTLIDWEIHRGVGVPYTIAEKAIEKAKSLGLTRHSRRRKDSYEENDQVWAVFDRDDHPRFEEAVANCETANVKVAQSNPCIELWLILHEQEFHRNEHRHEMQRILAVLRPEYDPSGSKTPDCDDIVKRVEEAERRSEKLLQRRVDDGNAYGNPSTTVGRLTREIREAHAQSSRPIGPSTVP